MTAPSVQPELIARLSGWSPLTVVATGGVLDRFPKDTEDPDDPEGTPGAFDHGTPLPCVYVADGASKPHPNARYAALGVEVWYVPIWFYSPSDDKASLHGMKKAVYDALAVNPGGTGPNWRFVTAWGTPATVYWQEDGSEPLIDPNYPDTWLDISRYRVESRRRAEVY